MEEKNKPGETVPEPGESERISAERKAALQDIDRKREEKEKLRQTQKQEAVKVHGSLSAYMNWPLLVCISLLILSIIITMIDWMAGVAASACSIVLIIGLMALSIYYHRRINSDMVGFGAGYAQIQKQLLQEMEFPYGVADETGRLIWMNQSFQRIVQLNNNAHKNLGTLFPGIDRQFPKNQRTSQVHSEYLGRKYQITIKAVSIRDIVETVVDEEDQGKKAPMMYAVYLSDETQMLEWKQKVEDEKLVAALIYLDNYDEVLDSIEETRRPLLIALIDRQITKYISAYHGVIKKLENDKYFAIVSNEHLKEMQANDFSLLEDVKTISIGNTINVTISIGLGINGGTYSKNYDYARMAIDMALGRGGDQVVLKNQDEITYYGGRTQSQGKNTRVKARVKAQALKELIEASSDVLIMGHSISDADCIGASVGIYRAARTSGKDVHIVLNTIANSIKPLLNRLAEDEEYGKKLFIDNETAIQRITEGTLLIVVDNNRPSRTECPQLLQLAQHVVVLDHHRQSRDCIEGAVLSYVEPYASSASEMVAEILQYYSDSIKIRPTDADAMYSGIVVDTNNFMNNTGVRTFEAAAFLRRNGADITKVRKLFRDDMEDYKAKAEAVREVEMFHERYAISVCPSDMTGNPTVIAAQAANELLGIRGIHASFVMTEYENQIYISARSIDEVNVQTIMEKLGGGGHMNVAGAQLRNVTLGEARSMLKDVLMAQEEKGDEVKG